MSLLAAPQSGEWGQVKCRRFDTWRFWKRPLLNLGILQTLGLMGDLYIRAYIMKGTSLDAIQSYGPTCRCVGGNFGISEEDSTTRWLTFHGSGQPVFLEERRLPYGAMPSTSMEREPECVSVRFKC